MKLNTTSNHTSHTELDSFFARIETERSLNTKNNLGKSISYTLFKTLFRAVDQLAPSSARQWGEKLFYTPRQRKLRKHDIEAIDNAKIEMLNFQGEDLPVYTWGSPDDPAILFIHGWGGRPTDTSRWIQPLIRSGFRLVSAEGPAHGSSKAIKTSLPELAEFLKAVAGSQENIYGYIGHSLGGAVVLLGFESGLDAKPSIFINTPADPEGIIDVFLKKIEGGYHIGDHIKSTVEQQFGRKFEEFSALYTAKKLPKIPVLLIHDRHDSESPIYHFEAFKEVIPWSEHLITDKLGHNRVLLDQNVIDSGVEFLGKNKKSLQN